MYVDRGSVEQLEVMEGSSHCLCNHLLKWGWRKGGGAILAICGRILTWIVRFESCLKSKAKEVRNFRISRREVQKNPKIHLKGCVRWWTYLNHRASTSFCFRILKRKPGSTKCAGDFWMFVWYSRYGSELFLFTKLSVYWERQSNQKVGRKPNFRSPKHRFGNKVLMRKCAKLTGRCF